MKKLLVIVTAFAPENATGSVRTTKLVKYLVRSGWSVTVISPKLSEDIKVDLTLNSRELNLVKKIEIPYGEFFDKYLYRKKVKMTKENSIINYSKDKRGSLFCKIKAKMFQKASFIYNLIRNHNWKKQVIRFLSNNFVENQFDFVFSSYPSTSSHLAAFYAFKQGIAKKWIADFRDSMTYEHIYSGLQNFLNNLIQKKICKNASSVIAVSEYLKNKLSREYEIDQKCFYLPNGFDEDDLSYLEKNEERNLDNYKEFKISYVGSLYSGKRDLTPLFKALHDLQKGNFININRVRFMYAGKDFEILRNQPKKFNLDKILVNEGFISRVESLNLQNNSDLITVSTWNTEKDQGIITGKIYECFLLRKPVLVIVNGTKSGSELSRMIKKSKLGISVETMKPESSYYEELKNFLLDNYNKSLQGKSYDRDCNKSFINFFNYQNLVERLEKIMLSTEEKNG